MHLPEGEAAQSANAAWKRQFGKLSLQRSPTSSVALGGYAIISRRLPMMPIAAKTIAAIKIAASVKLGT